MEFRVLCLSIIQFLLVSADLLGNHVLGKIACSIKAFQYLTLKAFQGVLSGFYLFLRCCTFCLLQVRLLSNPILSHLGIGCVSDLLEYFLYNFQDDGIHSLGKVQCLPITVSAAFVALAALKAVILGLDFFADTTIRQFVAVCVHKAGHLRSAVGAVDIRYTGPVTTDHYGRKVPKHAHGTRHLGRRTQSAKVILDAAMALFDRIVNPALLVRRVNIVALHILVGQEELPVPEVEQLDLFTDYAKLEQERLAEQARLERESRIQQAALSIKRKFGKNALVKGMDLQEDATAMTRNNQIGGHKA